jgi:SAM-dependent methyltransferase
MRGDLIYRDFAGIYDKLMADVDYKKWADYVEEVFGRNGLKPSLILDLGCGTGSFCIEMAKRGYEMIGVDISPEMLMLASSKANAAGADILYLNQDMTSFELYGTVDAAVCFLDSINYITDKRKLNRLFKLVNNYLNPGGLFIFDTNSQYKIKNILGNNVFYSVEDDAAYIWQNTYCPKTRKCEFDLTFFIQDGESYIRRDEIHYERAYSVDEIKGLAVSAGLKPLGIFDGLSFKHYKEKSERILFVCKKQY